MTSQPTEAPHPGLLPEVEGVGGRRRPSPLYILDTWAFACRRRAEVWNNDSAYIERVRAGMRPLLQIALKLRHFYWWLVRPITRGVRAIVANGMGHVLLVRHNYGEGWLLPGGAVRKNEDCETALRRELEEELGITDISIVNRLGEYRNTYEYKIDTIVVIAVGSFALEKKRHFEIEGWDFFDPRALPEGVSPGTRRRVEEWLGQKDSSNEW